MLEIREHGLYIISDEYFVEFSSPNMMDNKYETRPYYLVVKAEGPILWLIPLSSKVDKYQKSIEKDEQKRGKGNCIYHYISRFKGRDSVFLIGDAIPITKSYIKRAFTVNQKPFIIEDQTDIKNIRKKFSRYLALVRQGKLKPAVDILGIERELKAKLR